MAVWHHLYDPATDTHYDNGGFVPADSEVPVAGFKWVEGEAPDGAQAYRVLSLAEELNEQFAKLPLEVQADFAPLKAAVKLELEQGNDEVAKLIVQRATVPPELEETRTALIDQFDRRVQ